MSRSPFSSSPLPTRAPLPLLATLFVLTFTSFHMANGSIDDLRVDSFLITSKIETNRTILVDQSGNGDFKTVMAAIDAVQEGNSHWVLIHVRAGLYKEKIEIPENKPYIFMRGNGKGRTNIVWDESSTNNNDSATFTVKSPHFVAWGISFKNIAPVGEAGTSKNRSVAAYVAADKVAFYHCGFYSSHNTLFDSRGRHYYESCYITGSIDFIFGHGKSIFESCEIFVVADKRTTIRGSITAQYRGEADEETGFVFLKGKVYGIGGVYLGRARAAHSRVIFAKTYLSKTIVPEGWTNWSYDDTVDNLVLGEYHCHGPGAETAGRVPWSKQLTEAEAEKFFSINFIDGKDWLPVC